MTKQLLRSLAAIFGEGFLTRAIEDSAAERIDEALARMPYDIADEMLAAESSHAPRPASRLMRSSRQLDANFGRSFPSTRQAVLNRFPRQNVCDQSLHELASVDFTNGT